MLDERESKVFSNLFQSNLVLGPNLSAMLDWQCGLAHSRLVASRAALGGSGIQHMFLVVRLWTRLSRKMWTFICPLDRSTPDMWTVVVRPWTSPFKRCGQSITHYQASRPTSLTSITSLTLFGVLRRGSILRKSSRIEVEFQGSTSSAMVARCRGSISRVVISLIKS